MEKLAEKLGNENADAIIPLKDLSHDSRLKMWEYSSESISSLGVMVIQCIHDNNNKQYNDSNNKNNSNNN